MSVLEYMQGNPWMTLAFILAMVAVARYLVAGATILIRGYPPEHVNVHGEVRGDV